MVTMNKSTDSYKAFKTATWVLLELDFTTAATPINAIIYDYDIRLCPFSEIRKHINRDSSIYRSSGFLSKINDQYYIIYNDNDDIPRIRWTWAHELGHYFLKHNFENQDEYDIQEAEANYFASQLVMPKELLLILDKFYYLSEPVIEKYCVISNEAAKYRLNYYKKYKHTFLDQGLDKSLMEIYCHKIKESYHELSELNSLKRIF